MKTIEINAIYTTEEAFDEGFHLSIGQLKISEDDFKRMYDERDFLLKCGLPINEIEIVVHLPQPNMTIYGCKAILKFKE